MVCLVMMRQILQWSPIHLAAADLICVQQWHRCVCTTSILGIQRQTALRTLLSGNFAGLANVIGEVDSIQTELMDAVKPIIAALYSQDPGTSLEAAKFHEEENPKINGFTSYIWQLITVYFTSASASHTVKGYQSTRSTSSECTSQFGWEIKNDIPVPTVAQSEPAPLKLIDVIRCQCKVEGKCHVGVTRNT